MKVLSKPIEMISHTKEDGKIYPLKFKLENQLGESNIYVVQKLYTSNITKIAGNKMYIFTCEIIVNDEKKMCEIRYELDSCKWLLFKI